MTDQTPLTDDELRRLAGIAAVGMPPPYQTAEAIARELLAARARITELEERNANLDKAFQAAASQAAELATDAYEKTQAEEAAQASPDAYVAVKRTYSIHADCPEWSCDAAVIPATDTAECRHYAAQGFDLVPIVGTDAGTRHAAASEPVGYAVAIDSGVGPVTMQASPVLTRGDAVRRAAFYQESTDMDARVYELREVSGDA